MPSRLVIRRVPARRVLRGIGGFLLDWLPLFTVLFLYDEINNRLGPFLPREHTFPQIRVDQALFGGTVLTVVMQRALYSPGHPHLWDWVALAVYTSHFFVPIGIAVALRLRSRPAFQAYTTWFVVLTTLGFATYVAFPAVPPWLASQAGHLAPTHRIVRELWEFLGRRWIANLFSGSTVYANDVAAIPSLHAAYPLLIAIFFWRNSGRVLRTALALYALAMPLVLVYGAEHYVLDIVLGWAYVVASLLLVRRFAPAARMA